MSDDDVMGLPRAVRAADVPALNAAYLRAQHAELVVGWLLARAGIPASVAEPVAGVDAHGRPTVRVLVSTTAWPAPLQRSARSSSHHQSTQHDTRSGKAPTGKTLDMEGKTPGTHTSAVTAAVELVASQTGMAERILAQHYRMANGQCGGCFVRPVRYPCQTARIAELACKHPNHGRRNEEGDGNV